MRATQKQKEIHERAEKVARYIIEFGATLRATASAFGVSKSTVHKDVTQHLEKGSFLDIEVRKVLDRNWSEKAIRGGEATRQKYLQKH